MFEVLRSGPLKDYGTWRQPCMLLLLLHWKAAYCLPLNVVGMSLEAAEMVFSVDQPSAMVTLYLTIFYSLTNQNHQCLHQGCNMWA